MRQIANDRQLAGANAIQLSGINFEMHDARIRSKASRFPGHAVIEAGAKNQQQVGLVQCQIRRPRAVHSHHSQVIRLFRTHRAQAVNGRKSRDLQTIQNSAKIGHRA